MRAAPVLVIAILTACPVLAEEDKVLSRPQGQLIGHDGNHWVMEGCAAYPMTADSAAQQSKSTVANSWVRPNIRLAKNKTKKKLK